MSDSCFMQTISAFSINPQNYGYGVSYARKRPNNVSVMTREGDKRVYYDVCLATGMTAVWECEGRGKSEKCRLADRENLRPKILVKDVLGDCNKMAESHCKLAGEAVENVDKRTGRIERESDFLFSSTTNASIKKEILAEMTKGMKEELKKAEVLVENCNVARLTCRRLEGFVKK